MIVLLIVIRRVWFMLVLILLRNMILVLIIMVWFSLSSFFWLLDRLFVFLWVRWLMVRNFRILFVLVCRVCFWLVICLWLNYVFYNFLLFWVFGIIIRFFWMVIELNLCVIWKVCNRFLWNNLCGGRFVMFLLFMVMWLDVGLRMFVIILKRVVFFVLLGLIKLVIEFFLIFRFVLFIVWKFLKCLWRLLMIIMLFFDVFCVFCYENGVGYICVVLFGMIID